MTLKKAIAVLLASIIVFSCCSAAVYAAADPIPELITIVEDEIDSALAEQENPLFAQSENGFVYAAAEDTNACAQIEQALQSVSKPAKGTGIPFTLKNCEFPGFNDRKLKYINVKFFDLLSTLGIDNVFSGEYRILPGDKVEIVRIDNAMPITIIPSFIDNKPVTSIGDSAFANGLQANSPTFVFLPPTVVTISARAFANCEKLRYVIGSSNIETIGEMAFAGCVNLRGVLFYLDVWQSLSDASYAMFEFFQHLVESYLKKGLAEFGNLLKELIKGVPALINKVIFYNEKLKEIGRAAFFGCEQLIRVYIPAAVKTISEYAFCGCKKLEQLVINGAAAIRNWAFANAEIKHLYLACGVSWAGNTFSGSIIYELTYGGSKDEMPETPDSVRDIHAAVPAALEWKESAPISEAVDLNVFTTDAEAQGALTFESLNPEIVSVSEDGKNLVVNGVGKAELVCKQEESGSLKDEALNDGIRHSITIKTNRAVVQYKLNMEKTIPYKRDFFVNISALRTSNGEDIMPLLADNFSTTIEWDVKATEGSKIAFDTEANSSVCKIKYLWCRGTAAALDVRVTVKDANNNIICSATGTIGVGGDSVHASVRLTWWQVALKWISFGRY